MEKSVRFSGASTDRQEKLNRLRTLLGDGGKLVPATAAQQRFWVLAHAGTEPSFYHISEAVEMVGDLDHGRLLRCLEVLARRHEALRTGIATVQGNPVQLILPEVTVPLSRLETTRSEALEHTLREAANRPFDLACAPLWRMTVVPVAPDRHVLLVVFHHLISDGWSVAVFLRELLLCYAEELNGIHAPLAVPLQYSEYEAERLDRLTAEREQAQIQYWAETLRDTPEPLVLPVDATLSVDTQPCGATVDFDLGTSGEHSARLLAGAGKTTLFGVFMAVFNTMLNALSGETDLLVGTVVSGRHGRHAWETVVGPLINSVVLRTRIDPAESFGAFVSRSRDDLLRMLAHQDLPFDRLVEIAKVPRKHGGIPLAQVGIVYHEYPVQAPSGLPMTLQPLQLDTGRAQLDLSLIILNEDGHLRCRFEYDSRVFRRETVGVFRNLFLAILTAAGARPDDPVKEVCVASFPAMLPLHLTQHMRQIWQGEQVFGDPQLYRNTTAFVIPKALDVDVFLRAADFVAERTDGCRAYVDTNGGHPRLGFAARPQATGFHDFSHEADPECAFREWLGHEMARPADVEACPYRTDLARLGPERYMWHISAHHMFSDGRMVMVVVDRVSRVYGLLVARRLEPSAVSYPQIADQLRADYTYQRSARFRKDAEYWAKRFEKTDDPLVFFGRVPRKLGTVSDRVSCRLGAERSAGLRAMASLGMTASKGPDAFLCNAFGVILAVYLHKISGGATRIPFGSVNHNRRTPQSRDIVGLFMQVVPHVLEIGEGETFRSLMGKMDKEMLAALRHGQYAVENTMGRPIYDVLLNYHKETPVHFDGAQTGYEVIVRRATQSFGLNITNYDLSGDLELQFDFHRDVFDAEKYPRAIGHFLCVVDALLENPDALVDSVCVLEAQERRGLLVGFNDTRADFPLEKGFYAAFREVAAQFPEAVCASDSKHAVTYSELMESSGSLARRLLAEGVGANQVVPILAERGTLFLEAMLAIFQLGAAYLPLDPAAPSERLAHMVTECEASVILVQPCYFDRLLDDSRARCVTLGESGVPVALTSSASDDSRLRGPVEDTGRMAYVIYTSGSTGRPKGAMVVQRGMMNHLYAKLADLDLGPSDVVVQNASQCFDISVWQFLCGLLVGARTLVVPDATVLDPERFVALLEREGATVLEVVPSYLRVLLDHWDRPSHRDILPSLRLLLVTGEALAPDLVRRWMERRPEVPVVNAYGPTECSDDVTHHFVRSMPGSSESTIPIGRPIANTQLYILDGGLQPVPEGVEGELFVGGEGVGLGYLADAGRTRKAFIANPLPEGTSPVLYRSGDRVRLGTHGCLEFLGRLDHQVKLRGYRIELGEIEVVLRSHPDVVDAVVLLRSVQGADALVAYLEPITGSVLEQGDLRRLVAGKLPTYMVPQHWVFLDAIPLTPNGKTDRASLPEPDPESPAVSAAVPLSEVERDLASVWEAVLEHSVTEPDADFFALGGDSLRAIRVLSLAASKGLHVRMQHFLDRPTLRGMAASLETGSSGSVTLATRGILEAPADELGEVPLIGPQARFFDSRHGDPSHDNIAIWLYLDAAASVYAQAALEAVCAERDVFRLRFSRVEHEWRQYLGAEVVPPVFILKRLENPAEAETSLAAWANEAQRALDVEHGVLAGGLLVEAPAPGRSMLLVIVHHLVADAVSSRVLVGRLDLEQAQKKSEYCEFT